MTSPLGVKTNTSSAKRSNFKSSPKSEESRASLCQSRMRRSQLSLVSSSSICLPSLYLQWAAMPYSAVRCISKVRICTSKGRPWLTTVVCKDWYMLALGTEM